MTISPSAQNEMPSPYGRQRPLRHVASGLCRDVPAQLADEPALAHARLGDDGHELDLRLGLGTFEGLEQRVELRLRPRNGVASAPAGVQSVDLCDRLPDLYRLGLAFQRDLAQVVPLELVPRAPIGRVADGDAAGRAAFWSRAAVFRMSPSATPSSALRCSST